MIPRPGRVRVPVGPLTRLRLRNAARSGEAVLRPFPSVPLGQLVGCSAGLIFAGLLLARGFVGFRPGDPLVIVFGVVLAVSATLGLSTDHVAVRTIAARPRDVLAHELNRCRRHSHPLTLLAVRCDDETGWRIVTRLRGTDHAWRSGADLVVALPETDLAGATSTVERLVDLTGPGRARVAVFPDDGLTAQALQDRLGQPARPSKPTAVPSPVVARPPSSEARPDVGGPAQAEAG